MAAKHVGVVAGETLLAWQRDAVTELRADGATVVRIPASTSASAGGVDEIAARACPAFEAVPWPAAAETYAGEAVDAIVRFRAGAHGELPEAACILELVLPEEPSCFAAVERADAAIAVRVDRIDAGGRRSVVVAATVASDPTSYARTLRRIARVAVDLPRRALRRAGDPAFPITAAAEPDAQVHRPSAARIALLAVRCALRRVRAALVRIAVSERWSVGVLTTPLSDVVRGSPADVRWLPLKRTRFWADPFPLPRDGAADLLCEGYDYGVDRGHLVRVAIGIDGTIGEPARLTGLTGHHLSYPYVVDAGGARYVVPEQSEARRVAAYTILDDALAERAVLLEGIAAVDPTPFSHAGRWWMYLADRDRDPNGELLLYCADAFAGPWTAHPLNPIVCDVGCARPAGTPFVLDGTLYRPGQDCTNGYGSRIAIARVDRLSRTTYSETIVGHLQSRGSRGRSGMHTLGVSDALVFVDGKDAVFDPAASFAVIRQYARRLWGRAGSPARSPGDLRPAPGDSAASRGESSLPATLW